MLCSAISSSRALVTWRRPARRLTELATLTRLAATLSELVESDEKGGEHARGTDRLHQEAATALAYNPGESARRFQPDQCHISRLGWRSVAKDAAQALISIEENYVAVCNARRRRATPGVDQRDEQAQSAQGDVQHLAVAVGRMHDQRARPAEILNDGPAHDTILNGARRAGATAARTLDSQTR